MSKNVKIVLIVAGILVFLSVACVGGAFLTGYLFVDNKGIDESIKQGKEFGQTTDNLGCQTKIISMIKPLSNTDVNETLKVQYFFDSCLETSRPTTDFCKDAANPYSDIFNDDKAKDAECTKIGLEGSIPCRQVIDKKLDFCMSRK
ncbi:MAG: hypothetical protein ABIP06_01845 [Pyrinomonadaceae bacterium]